MKNIIITLSLIFTLSGCYTLNTHPDLQTREENGDRNLVFVMKDTRCLDCHTNRQLVDFGYLVAIKDDEIDSLKLQYPYWAGDKEAIVIPEDEYYAYTPQLYETIIYIPSPPPPPPPPPCWNCGEPPPLPPPVPVPPVNNEPPVTKERAPEVTDYRGDTRNNGGRGTDDSRNNGRTGNEDRGNVTSKNGR